MTGILVNGHWRRPLLRVITHVVLTVASAAAVFPFLWMVLSSFKTKAEVMEPGLALPAVWQWGNYREILLESPIPRYLFNSLFVASLTMALQVVCCALFAYAVVFMRFKGRRLLFSLVLFTYMVPTAATYIPCYVLLARLGLLDSYRGLILSNGVSVFGIFLLRQAFGQIPAAAVEAARMDGAGHFTVLRHIALPMARPNVITFMLLAFIGTYNSYMWPSLITDTPEKSLISQGLRRFLYEGGAYGTQWPLVMAAGSAAAAGFVRRGPAADYGGDYGYGNEGVDWGGYCRYRDQGGETARTAFRAFCGSLNEGRDYDEQRTDWKRERNQNRRAGRGHCAGGERSLRLRDKGGRNGSKSGCGEGRTGAGDAVVFRRQNCGRSYGGDDRGL